MSKISDVASKEITKSEELPYFMHIGRGWRVFDCFEFVCARLDTLFSESKAKVGNFFTAKEAFLKVDFNVVLYQPLQDVIKRSDVFLVGR